MTTTVSDDMILKILLDCLHCHLCQTNTSIFQVVDAMSNDMSTLMESVVDICVEAEAIAESN
jgi:hypothetical protein